MQMNVNVNGSDFTATLEQNTAVDSLVEMLRDGPLTLELSDYAGFEKVGPLGTSLPTSNQQTTTQAGDIVLYQGNQIVMFYGSNSWSYTRLGHIDDLTGWEEALGSGDVTVTFFFGGLNDENTCLKRQPPAPREHRSYGGGFRKGRAGKWSSGRCGECLPEENCRVSCLRILPQKRILDMSGSVCSRTICRRSILCWMRRR